MKWMVSAWLAFPKLNSGSCVSFISSISFLSHLSPPTSRPPTPNGLILERVSSRADLGFHTWECVSAKRGQENFSFPRIYSTALSRVGGGDDAETYGGGRGMKKPPKGWQKDRDLRAEAAPEPCPQMSAASKRCKCTQLIEIHEIKHTHVRRKMRNRPALLPLLIPSVITHGLFFFFT